MSSFTYRTAGESHGQLLTALVDGVPAGLRIAMEAIDRDLRRRQEGFGRGDRMKIEADRVEVLSGVRWGKTTGAPLLLGIWNRDWENWKEAMSPDPSCRESLPPVTHVRPGHADLPGALKYGLSDARDVLERSSARETAARVAAGAVAKILLAEFGVHVGSFVTSVAEVELARSAWASGEVGWLDLHRRAEEGQLRFPDAAVDAKAVLRVTQAREQGDTLGGTFVCFATGVPVGLGTHTQWHERLDGRLGQAFLSIQAIKGVEIGSGFEASRLPGSEVHDEIFPGSADDRRKGGVRRLTNRAGGLEGGISNGEDVWIRAAMKPIPTLMRPLRTVDLATGAPTVAARERSDVCAVPAASVVGEGSLAVTLAAAFGEKFGGDNVEEMRGRFDHYLKNLGERWTRR
jgi:chorismate synthase